MSEGSENMRNFLRKMHGKDPQPLRCEFTRAEATGLVRASRIGSAVFSDMNIEGYGGKLAQALEMQVNKGLDPVSWDFWQGARLAFLELGGRYASGQEPPVKRSLR